MGRLLKGCGYLLSMQAHGRPSFPIQEKVSVGQGEGEGTASQEPRGPSRPTSELSDALSVRYDKNSAMRCRKKINDALSVRSWAVVRGSLHRSPLIGVGGDHCGFESTNVGGGPGHRLGQ